MLNELCFVLCKDEPSLKLKSGLWGGQSMKDLKKGWRTTDLGHLKNNQKFGYHERKLKKNLVQGFCTVLYYYVKISAYTEATMGMNSIVH